MSHFEPAAWREFLDGGHVRTVHIDAVPIWAGFIIAQLGELQAQIGVLLMTQAVSLHQLFQGDMTQMQAAFNQLITANNAAKTYSNQLLTQIASLQGQLAAPDGDPVTGDDLAAMNTLAAQISQAAAATITTGAAPTTSSTAAGAPVAGSDTSGSADATTAPTSDSTAATEPAAAAPVDVAPTTDPTTVPDTTSSASAAYPVQPVTIDASDSGTGASE